VELWFHHGFYPGRYHSLRDAIADGRDAEHSGSRSVRLRDFNSLYRGRKVRSRRHPVPDLVKVPLQIGLKFRQADFINPGSALVGRHLQICLPHLLLGNIKRLSR
jgi:hypothetical protein